jgi:2-haloacid dehalogenase
MSDMLRQQDTISQGIADHQVQKGDGMKLTDFDALSFDCYGTLIDWEHGLREGLQKVAALRSPSLDIDALLESYGDAEAVAERTNPGMLYPQVIAESVARAGDTHGVTVPPELGSEIGSSAPDWPAFPDSAEALGRLSQRYKLIILSNVDRASFAGSNERLGVTFDAVLTAEDIGSYKPNPRNFAALLEQVQGMGIAQNKLLHVAQSLFHDHMPAKALGLSTVWIDRRGSRPGYGATPIPENAVQPDWTFPSMAAFADAVEAED